MLPATPNRLVIAWFDWYCRYALRKHFAHVHVVPESPTAWPPPSDKPLLVVANHTGFWDGIVLNFLGRHALGGRRMFCVMDEVQVRKHPFFRRVGGFSVDRTSPRDGLRAMTYAADLLNASPRNVVVIFPQGEALPNDQRPLGFENGVARILRRVPDAYIVPVAIRYDFWNDQRPEALVWWGEGRRMTRDGREAVRDLESIVTRGLDVLREACLRRKTDGQIVLRGRHGIHE